jgi:hypothetical protein
VGHRALIAYERTDQNYNLHYSHWGAANLRLKQEITDATPFGGDLPSQWARTTHRALTEGADPETVRDQLELDPPHQTDIEPLPRATGLTLETILTEHLDYLSHEAFYVVDRDCSVTAYRTLWFGLEYESDVATKSPTIGHGATVSVRWHQRQPVNDGYVQGQFQGMKRIVGQMVDRGVFDQSEATRYLATELAAVSPSNSELWIAIDGERFVPEDG